MLSTLLACLVVFGAVTTGDDPYFLLRPRLEAADAVVLGKVRSVTDVKEILSPDERVAVLELTELWKGGNPDKVPETLDVRDWYGPEPDSRRRTPWVFFLGRSRGRQGPSYEFQAAVDLSSLSSGRRAVFKERVAEFFEIEGQRNEQVQLRATVSWLMDQVRDPVSREGATYDLERPAYHKRLTKEQVRVLQNLYCSLSTFDSVAGHLTDILDEVAVDRDQFVRCAFGLLEGEVDRATWMEEGLVGVLENSLECDEVAALAQEYRATQPVVRMRGIEDSPDLRAARSDVLRRLCEAAQRKLDAPPVEALPEPDAPPSQEVAAGGAGS